MFLIYQIMRYKKNSYQIIIKYIIKFVPILFIMYLPISSIFSNFSYKCLRISKT